MVLLADQPLQSYSTVDVSDIEASGIECQLCIEGTGTGIPVNSTYGQPGSDATIRIRGFGSVTGSNAPLYVLDGVRITGISDLSERYREYICTERRHICRTLDRASNGVI